MRMLQMRKLSFLMLLHRIFFTPSDVAILAFAGDRTDGGQHIDREKARRSWQG